MICLFVLKKNKREKVKNNLLKKYVKKYVNEKTYFYFFQIFHSIIVQIIGFICNLLYFCSDYVGFLKRVKNGKSL